SCVLRVLHREGMRMPATAFDLGDVARDLDVAGQDSEIRIATKDEFNPMVGEPVDLAVETLEIERVDLRLRRRAPVAERAGEWAAAVGFPHRDPVFSGVRTDEGIEHAIEIRRR